MTRQSTRGPVRRLLLLAGCIVLAGHFLLIAIFIAPLNPLKVWLFPAAYSYVVPLFEQNWSLFAPRPINFNETVAARYACCRDKGHCRVSSWYDLSGPGMRLNSTSPFSPTRRLMYGLGSMTKLTTEGEPTLDQIRGLHRELVALGGSSDFAARLAWMDTLMTRKLADRQRIAEQSLFRFASALGQAALGSRCAVGATELMVLRHRVPAYLGHFDSLPTPEPTVLRLGWRPRDQDLGAFTWQVAIKPIDSVESRPGS